MSGGKIFAKGEICGGSVKLRRVRLRLAADPGVRLLLLVFVKGFSVTDGSVRFTGTDLRLSTCREK